MELSFSTAGGCTRIAVFWIWAWAVLITHQCFPCGWTVLVKHQNLLFPFSATPVNKNWEWAQPAMLTKHHTLHHNIVPSNKCSRKGGGRGVTLETAVFVFPCNSCPGFQEIGKASDCWWEILNLFLVLLENKSY